MSAGEPTVGGRSCRLGRHTPSPTVAEPWAAARIVDGHILDAPKSHRTLPTVWQSCITHTCNGYISNGCGRGLRSDITNDRRRSDLQNAIKTDQAYRPNDKTRYPVPGSEFRHRIPFILSRINAYALTAQMRAWPVISAGCSRSMILRIVGATSARRPSATFTPLFSVT